MMRKRLSLARARTAVSAALHRRSSAARPRPARPGAAAASREPPAGWRPRRALARAGARPAGPATPLQGCARAARAHRGGGGGGGGGGAPPRGPPGPPGPPKPPGGGGGAGAWGALRAAGAPGHAVDLHDVVDAQVGVVEACPGRARGQHAQPSSGQQPHGMGWEALSPDAARARTCKSLHGARGGTQALPRPDQADGATRAGGAAAGAAPTRRCPTSSAVKTLKSRSRR